MGLPGFLLFLLLGIAVIFRWFRIYATASPGFVKQYALAVTLGLITYFVHGCMNNFLETDKLSVPFWAMLAIITVLDNQNSSYTGKANHKADHLPLLENRSTIVNPSSLI
jgi:O-antigen ligase